MCVLVFACLFVCVFEGFKVSIKYLSCFTARSIALADSMCVLSMSEYNVAEFTTRC